MKHFALIVALCLPAALAHAGTFELSDPAAEMREDQQAMGEQVEADELKAEYRAVEEAAGEHAAVEAPGDSVLCTVDTDTGDCSCIDKTAARALTLTRDECVARIRDSLKTP